MNLKRGIGLLVLATILWSGNYVCGRYLAPALPSPLLNTVRWAISTAILFGILFIMKKRIHLLANWKEFLVTGFYGIFAFSTLNYFGLRFISASQAGMISAATPAAILLFTPFVLKERVPLKAWIGTAISIFGVILLFQGKQADASQHSLIGEIAIILSCLSWGLYTVYGKKYGKKIDSLTMTAGASFYGTILSAISCAGTVEANMINMTPGAWLAILYVSTFASVGAFLCWNIGLNLVGAGRSAPYVNLLPVWTVALGMILLQEKMSAVSFLGGAIAILGAVLASMPRSRLRDVQ
jgi:drug/metabolite transporter (DMT)-like permease